MNQLALLILISFCFNCCGEFSSNQQFVSGVYKNDIDVDSGEYAILELKYNNKTQFGYYYSSTDDFDLNREGYLPGFFCVMIKDLKISSNQIYFKIKIPTNEIYNEKIHYGNCEQKNGSKWGGEFEIESIELTLKGKIFKDKIVLNNINDNGLSTPSRTFFIQSKVQMKSGPPVVRPAPPSR